MRKNYKKSFVSALVLMMSVSLTACSSSTSSSKTNSTQDLSAPKEFSWTAFSGQEINVMLNQHPYADAIIKRLPEFEKKTGIKVKYSVTPEDSYFDKVTTALNSKNGNPDVFMTGSYQLWEYAPANYIEPLDSYLNNKGLTSADYDVNDFYKGILDGDKWDLKPGHPVGSGNLWALPLGFETNVLLYNKRAFAKLGITPPKTFEELVADATKLNGWNGDGSYGIAVRGTRSWATIHPGYMTEFSMNGAKDFAVENGKLVSKLDSLEAIDITKKFTDLIKKAGPKDWTNYTWYQVGADLGAGKAAMALDADIIGFFQNQQGASKEAGNIGWAPAPLPKDGATEGANEWIWSIAMNKASKHKGAAWLFMQYFTSKEHMQWGSTEANVVDPVRKSVWDSPQFQSRISKLEGYNETHKAIIENTNIKFTPQPEFFNTTTEWAAALQDIVTGKATADDRMKQLANDINKIVSRVRVE
jgi:multiple sugar transport system substrate-binding protein